ncbi:unnamed protein product [Musa hybrid cultivar]
MLSLPLGCSFRRLSWKVGIRYLGLPWQSARMGTYQAKKG